MEMNENNIVVNISSNIKIDILPTEPLARETVIVGKIEGKQIVKYKDTLLNELKKPLYENLVGD